MNKLLSSFIILVIGLVGGYFIQPSVQQQLQVAGLMNGSTEGGSDKPEALYWVAPMNAKYRRDKPGKSPMGMDLIPVYEVQKDGLVSISPVVQNNLGVRVDKVQKAVLDREINTVGYISFDEEKLYHLHTRVEGWVEKLNVRATGDVVTKGQKLFELYSPALVNAQEEYLTALRSKNKILINASKDRLSALGVSNRHIKQLVKTRKVRQRIDYVSKHDGFIKDLKVREGMFIKPSMDVLTIAQIDTVWVIAEVFERQSGWVKKGQTVDMKVVAYPEKQWQGKVDYIYPILDPTTRTLRVRIRFDNKQGLLKPNMFSRLIIRNNSGAKSILVKREAIIRNGRMERVVKALGDGKFLSVKVKTGNENSEFIEILEGLSENDIIVTSAQFLIDSESSLTASFARMEEPNSSDKTMLDKGMDMKDDKMDVSALGGAIVPEKLKQNQAWVKATVLSVMANDATLKLQHESITRWDWPAMKMSFSVDSALNISIFEKGEAYNFLLEKHSGGAVKIVDFNKKVAP